MREKNDHNGRLLYLITLQLKCIYYIFHIQ